MIDDGELQTVIDRTYCPEARREAHDDSQSGRVRGKLVLDFTDCATAWQKPGN